MPAASRCNASFSRCIAVSVSPMVSSRATCKTQAGIDLHVDHVPRPRHRIIHHTCSEWSAGVDAPFSAAHATCDAFDPDCILSTTLSLMCGSAPEDSGFGTWSHLKPLQAGKLLLHVHQRLVHCRKLSCHLRSCGRAVRTLRNLPGPRGSHLSEALQSHHSVIGNEVQFAKPFQ